MTLPTSGTITLAMIRTELGRTGTISLNDADCRSLAGKPSGLITLADFYGKSVIPPTTHSLTVGMLNSGMGDTWWGFESTGNRGSMSPVQLGAGLNLQFSRLMATVRTNGTVDDLSATFVVTTGTLPTPAELSAKLRSIQIGSSVFTIYTVVAITGGLYAVLTPATNPFAPTVGAVKTVIVNYK